MLSWYKVIPIIFSGILYGTFPIVLLELVLFYKPELRKKIERHCKEWILRIPETSIFYKPFIFLTNNEDISYSPLSPNIISLIRMLATIIIVPIVTVFNKELAIKLFVAFAVGDAIDGEIARLCKLKTKFGEKFDPFCDKICYLSAMYIFLKPSQWIYYLLISEVWGQFGIRPLLPLIGREDKVAANSFGKIKAVLCFSSIPYSYLIDIGVPLTDFRQELLKMCLRLSIASWAFKFIKDKYYANILTGLNLLCGIGALKCIWYEAYNYALLLIIGGQCFDALDGRAAEKFGSTPSGAILDDIADFLSFGIVPAVLLIFISEKTRWAYFMGYLFIAAILFRLVRFILFDKEISEDTEKNRLNKFSLRSRKFVKDFIADAPILNILSYFFYDKKGREREENMFAGLPSPGAATMAIGASLLITGWPLWIIIFITIFLTVSRFHFPHFSRNIMPKIGTKWKVIIGSLVFILAAYTLCNKNSAAMAFLAFLSGSIYIIYNLYKYNFLFYITKNSAS